MIQFVEGGTLLRATRGEELLVRENPDVSLLGRIFGALGSTAFLAAALFFWRMPVDSVGFGTDLARIALCGGLALIGAVIGWSALYPRKSVSQLEVDPVKREVRLGSVKPEADFKAKHVMKFADVKRFYAGSETSTDVHDIGGTTILYVEASSGPRNGATIVGSAHELENLAREFNQALTQPIPVASSPAPDALAQRRGGFGRRGL